jgi:uncharacterized protein YndB with AHSA1/START domain
MTRTVRMERFYPYAPEQVWAALTDSDILASWLMRNDFAPTLGLAFNFRKDPQPGWDGFIHCEVIELEPQKRLAYTWRGQASGAKTMACAGIESEAAGKAVSGIMTSLDTVVRYTLHPENGGTRLAFEHSGFEGLKGLIVSFVMGMGWRKLLGKLDTAIASQKASTATA